MFNLFTNLGGHGGYQILTETLIQGLRKEFPSEIDSINIIPMITNDTTNILTQNNIQKSSLLPNGLYKISLAIEAPSFLYTGDVRINYPMFEGSKIPDIQLAKLKTLDYVLVSNKYHYDILEKYNFNNLFLFSGFVNVDTYRPLKSINRTFLRYKREISKDEPYIFTIVGKYENRKSTSEMIEAVLLYESKHPGTVRLNIKWSSTVSTRPLILIKKELEPIFDRYPNHFNVVSLINSPDVDMLSLYNESDCLLYASKAEGIGLPLLEAMSSMLPVIYAPYSALTEHIKHNVGIVLPNRGSEPMNDSFYGIKEKDFGTWGSVQVDDIVEAIDTFINEDIESRYIRTVSAREYVLKYYNYRERARELIEIIKNIR